MRLWSLHPKYLDRKGLLTVWREGLLAKKVLEGRTKGYKNHSQFLLYINTYLYQIYLEAVRRGYRFDLNKIIPMEVEEKIPVTRGQVVYEFYHLLKKLERRDKKKYEELKNIDLNKLEINPIFKIVEGGIEPWEKVKID
ncbi:hypothetical protein BA065_02645 [Nanoarchaeota archaeon NZ13-N]|nr:MAG: hypothetical protein BA065_02645 [Nanoarchaeota archaeon NZ13-N]